MDGDTAPKRKAVVSVHGDDLEITPLGAGNEVGRSCIILKFKGKTLMLDCGIHPGYTGLAGLPFFDEIDPATIDVLLISHFHLDHAAALPWFLEKTAFKGKVFMTYPTKVIYRLLLTDFLKVSNISTTDSLYDEKNLAASMERIEPVNFHEEKEVSGIKFLAYNAGHVLGAAMFMIEIAGVKILYTGDYSRQEDRHLMQAELPSVTPDILIVESTYGVQVHEPRLERETRFTRLIQNIVGRGGRCLIPSFALGRAQELLLIMDEFWAQHPELHHVPIYYASALASKCMTVYQTYIHMMNEHIRSQFSLSNPFKFKHILPMKGLEGFSDTGPSVVMASPGMLQSGLSRDLLERWAPDRRNGCIISGYCVEGTLAKHILTNPTEFSSSTGLTVPLNMTVEYISFSAHADFKQTSEFIDQLQPPYVVLVHGDTIEMGRLKAALLQRYEGKPMQILSPKNCQSVELKFRQDKLAKTLGQLAQTPPAEGNRLAGVLVRQNFQHTLLAPSELHTFTQIPIFALQQRLSVRFRRPLIALRQVLFQIYDEVEEDYSDPEAPVFKIESVLMLRVEKPLPKPDASTDAASTSEEEKPKVAVGDIGSLGAVRGGVAGGDGHTLWLEWASDALSDMLADALCALILQLEVSPVPVLGGGDPVGSKATRTSVSGGVVIKMEEDDVKCRKRAEEATLLLQQMFGLVQVDDADPYKLNLAVDGVLVSIDCRALRIDCAHEALKARVEQALLRLFPQASALAATSSTTPAAPLLPSQA